MYMNHNRNHDHHHDHKHNLSSHNNFLKKCTSNTLVPCFFVGWEESLPSAISWPHSNL